MTELEQHPTEEKPHPELVEVTLTITDEQGDTTTQTKEIPVGPTPVTTLKQELGVPDTETLFLLREGHKPKVLADHETHDVKAGDHYEVISKGGAS